MTAGPRQVDLDILQHAAMAKDLAERPVLQIIEALDVLHLPIRETYCVIKQP
jgi:hypothetical protein